MILSCAFCREYETCQALRDLATVVVSADTDVTDREVCVAVEKALGAEAPTE